MKILLLTVLVASILLMAKFEAPARHGIARLGRAKRPLPFGRMLHLWP